MKQSDSLRTARGPEALGIVSSDLQSTPGGEGQPVSGFSQGSVAENRVVNSPMLREAKGGTEFKRNSQWHVARLLKSISDREPLKTLEDERKCTVLHICETSKGGIGTFLGVFSSFDPSRIQSIVVAPEQHSEDLDPGVTVRTFHRPRRGPRAVLNMLRTARRVALEAKPDIIVCHSSFSLAAVAWFRTFFSGCRILYLPHGLSVCRYEQGTMARRIARRVESWLVGFADIVVHASEYERKVAESQGYRGQHMLIENAVRETSSLANRDDTPPKNATDASKTHLLFVGRLDRQKGFDVLVDAFRQIASDRPDLVLHVVGESVVNDSSVDALPDNIVMHGWVTADEIDDWYASTDALIVPSRWEAFGLVVAEAMRNGRPALVSDNGALPFLVDEGKTGHVFPLDPDAIADLLRKIEKENLQQMQTACRNCYEDRFTVSRLESQFLRLLACLADYGNPRPLSRSFA